MPQPLDSKAPYAGLVRRYFGGRLRRARLVPSGAISGCYWNATQAAAQFGGRVVCGYLVTDMDGVLLEGIHHAVVAMPNGELVDFTPYIWPGFSHVSFVPDGSSVPSLDVPAYLDNIFVPLKHHDLVKELADAHKAACEAQRNRAQIFHEAGYFFEPGMPLPDYDPNRLSDKGACVEQQRLAVQRFKEVDERIQKLLQRYRK